MRNLDLLVLNIQKCILFVVLGGKLLILTFRKDLHVKIQDLSSCIKGITCFLHYYAGFFLMKVKLMTLLMLLPSSFATDVNPLYCYSVRWYVIRSNIPRFEIKGFEHCKVLQIITGSLCLCLKAFLKFWFDQQNEEEKTDWTLFKYF